MVSNFGTATASGKTLLLEVQDLRIEAESSGHWNEVVKGVSFSLHRGEVVGLIGESGAGKSTIGLSALGYSKPGCRKSGGKVFFEGKELFDLDKGAIRKLRGMRIAYVAQSAAAFFNPAHRLIDQFVEVLSSHGHTNRTDACDKAIKFYGKLGLPEPDKFGFKYPHQASGGQLQRAMIAMAMAGDPDIIVFDEPTTALDVTTQVEVLAAIRDAIHQTNSAALYITHDLAVVAQVADRILVLRHGAAVELAETDELLGNARQDYTRRLLAADPEIQTERPGKDCVLSVDGLSVHYGKKKVLHDISLEIPAGRTTAIVGESGSGKSTLARAIAGLLKSVEGNVRFQGATLSASYSRRPRDVLRRLQLIYQSPDTALNPKQRISEILGRPVMFYHNVDRAEADRRVANLLQLVELNPAYADRYPTELSGGQKQRVCIARALAAEPDLIICDEVTSGLDPLIAKDILALLARLQKELGTTYIFITHDLKIVNAIADQVVVMKAGRIVERGMRSEVMNPPHAPYTETLLRSVPQMDVNWLDRLLESRKLVADEA
ncbi:ABC transporter ATP-binding protein [Rhizobium sp. KVB221]|uniref:ABC transporter ATP-binding protein n=1 Tax=Rhizobium setariae TaxID=2801340 RepID=A0A937CQR4_9HYPH|nr:ABC transporter ATP-binding protein [Rhizobium setariae]MBL0373342.1 ABC transporter ATP-binding protein [Rhizobium setariae]